MPFASNAGVRIHYAVEGAGPPLVLQHGTSGDLESWYARGYVERLRQRFRLVLVDSRGHGKSDRPLEPQAYALPHRVADIAAVLDALGIDQAHFFGYSMGGWIGYGAAMHQPERFRSLVIGGFAPVPDPYFGRSVDALVEEVAELRAARGEPLSDLDRTVLHLVFAETARFGGAVEALHTTTLPILLFAGDRDPRYASVRDAVQAAPTARFFALPGKDHGGALVDDPDAVVPQVAAFLEDVAAMEPPSAVLKDV